MILIVTHKTDYTADFVVGKLNDKSANYYRLNCEDILQNKNVKVEFESLFKASINGYSSFHSVWFRRTKMPDLSMIEPGLRTYCLIEFDYFLKNLWHSISTKKWMSLPHCAYLAENKLLQLQVAKKLGFQIPPTIVTGNPEEIKAFFVRHHGEVIIKPIYHNLVHHGESDEIIFTNKVTRANLDNLDERIALPSIYQKYIEKKLEYRITVVDERVFSATVDSQSDIEARVDWRKKKMKFKPAIVPDDVSMRCVELVRRLGLTFGAIDLIEDLEGNFVFLEINPNGQWAWIESDTGLPISESIVQFLLND